MTVLCQGQVSITDFYRDVYRHLSLILDKVYCLDLNESRFRAVTDRYRRKTFATFIRGLNGDLSIRELFPLPQALHVYLKLDNINFRRNYAQSQLNKRDRAEVCTINNKNFSQNWHISAGLRQPIKIHYQPTIILFSRIINILNYVPITLSIFGIIRYTRMDF